MKKLFATLRVLTFIALTCFVYVGCNKDEIDNQIEEIPVESNPGEWINHGGHEYPTVILGNGQEWMAENLRTSTYANGDTIPNVAGGTQWVQSTTDAWAYYNNDSLYEEAYGKLYNWFAVVDSRNLCPDGWHVATDLDWNVFIDYLDPNADGGNLMPNTAGGKMKSNETQYWPSPNTDGTNESGFSGRPSGNRYYNGIFYGVDITAYWWSSTSQPTNDGAWCRVLTSHEYSVLRTFQNEKTGMCVRCIKD